MKKYNKAEVDSPITESGWVVARKEGVWVGQNGWGRLGVQLLGTIPCNIDKLQGCIVQSRQYSQYIIYKTTKLLWYTSETNTISYVNYTSIKSINTNIKELEQKFKKNECLAIPQHFSLCISTVQEPIQFNPNCTPRTQEEDTFQNLNSYPKGTQLLAVWASELLESQRSLQETVFDFTRSL